MAILCLRAEPEWRNRSGAGGRQAGRQPGGAGAEFCFDWFDAETGKRIRQVGGIAPREAEGAWPQT
jgi:hypothetical protein